MSNNRVLGNYVKNLGLIVALACTAAIAGCASPQAHPAAEATPAPSVSSPSPSPTPTPTPTAMATDAAGKYYLDTVCRSNRLVDPMNAAFADKTTQTIDVKAARAAAGSYRDGLAATARALSSPPLPWPQAVKTDVDTFVNDLYTDIASADALAGQTTPKGLISSWNASKDSGAGTPAKAIRIKLGLPTDSLGSCGMS